MLCCWHFASHDFTWLEHILNYLEQRMYTTCRNQPHLKMHACYFYKLLKLIWIFQTLSSTGRCSFCHVKNRSQHEFPRSELILIVIVQNRWWIHSERRKCCGWEKFTNWPFPNIENILKCVAWGWLVKKKFIGSSHLTHGSMSEDRSGATVLSCGAVDKCCGVGPSHAWVELIYNLV